MKIVIQRVSQASVNVEDAIVGSIRHGVLVFVGVTHTDTEAQVTWLANKLVHLRMFEDESGKINRSLLEEKGSALIVSQFTLYADCAEGRRPSFGLAAPPAVSKPLFDRFVNEVQKHGILVQTGIFGAKMKVSLMNEGPITLILER